MFRRTGQDDGDDGIEVEVDEPEVGVQAPTSMPIEYTQQDMPAPSPALPPLSPEMQHVLGYVHKYKPSPVSIPTPLKPFMPEYIPAVSVVDAFIKVPRPDGQPDFLGLRVLDEPALDSSDPAMLRMQLKTASKDGCSALGAAACMGVVHDPEKHGQQIDEWMRNVADLVKSKAPSEVRPRSTVLPPLSALVEPWPPELEHVFANAALPDATPDVDLIDLCRIACGLLDIPLSEDRPVEALHLLFSAYLEIKASPWLGQNGGLQQEENGGQGNGGHALEKSSQRVGGASGSTLLTVS